MIITVVPPVVHPRDPPQTHLAPYQHGTKHDLETVKEVVPYDYNRGPSRRPPLTRTYRLDAGCGYNDKTIAIQSGIVVGFAIVKTETL